MPERILYFSIRHRWLVVIATAAVAVFGLYNYTRLPIDAVPDITNVQVQVNTEAPGYSPFEGRCFCDRSVPGYHGPKVPTATRLEIRHARFAGGRRPDDWHSG